ncbi:hypothetical protein CBR_g19473 [Chara braunii]|uniref:Reverse transcriptase domain-containing protein n=1 Tax=Chara braunii TaxID=69332 RepID=A0A388KY33_CHABU|nr:hypothetical protein CBR_g19473 [Chara braunii]|eukprot:GBG74959.1 hypothetical protein CBR_g19473 [Chara braunii]
MDTAQGGELVAYEQPSPSAAVASTSGASSSSDAADVVDPLEYLHLAGMVGVIRSAHDDLEWVDRESNPGPQFRTGEIDVLRALKQLDIRVPIPVGHLLTISEAANDKLLQHCQKNEKRFTYQRVQRMLKKKEGGEEVAPPEPETGEPKAARVVAISLAEKDHFVQARPVLWKSVEYDCEVWGKSFNALIDTESSAVAISLDTSVINVINYCVIVYVDDILVYSSSYEGHVQHIEWALHVLRDAGFKVAFEKCQFFLTTISFLGHVVTDQGLRPEPQKVAAVRDASVPMTITQVRAFLGLALYYRRFVKGFAAIAGPLTNLLRKDQPLIWTSECDQAFSELKAALISAPVLIRPDPEKSFVLITDWQLEAISAILAQVAPSGLENVVEYVSKSVPACKRNYAAPTGECYAALWGISHFRAYLYGRKFILVTDHEPLLALKKSKDYSGMIGRWATVLQSMHFDIRHRKHERHGNADGLTRLHRPEKVPKNEEVTPWNEPKKENGPRYDQVEILSKDACLEEPGDEDSLPSQQKYLKPYGIIDHAFYPKAEEVVIEGEESGDDEETSKEGSYSEYSEGEQSEEEEEEEETRSEWEALAEEATCTGTEAEDLEAARKREEIATRNRQLEFASGASLRIGDDPTRDPEPPKPEDGDPAAATPSTSRRRRSRSSSPSSPTRPPVRPRTDARDRPSSPFIIPSSP